MPFIRASPSDLSTIYTILNRLVELALEVGQSHILITADMAIYSKAQQVMWQKPPTLDGKVTMRVGGMHTTMALIASIGKLYGHGGLRSLWIESSTYAEATAGQMLQGKQVDRGIRGLKIVYEALFRVFYTSFQAWLEKSNHVSVVDDPCRQKLQDLQHAFRSSNPDTPKTSVGELMEDGIDLNTLMGDMNKFIAEGRAQSKTFAYWDDFMKGVRVLLHMLRAERDGMFDLHLSAMCEALPWFRAAGRHNYAKYVPCYITDMQCLQQKQPESYHHLSQGGFVVRHKEDYNFNAVSTDQALEQTINKEGKSQGGIIGLTLRKEALMRWLMTRHVTAEFSDAFRSMCRQTPDKTRKHGELSKSRKLRDESDVVKVTEVLKQNQNPFDLNTVPSELINIITGQVATTEVTQSLGSFLEVGQKKHKDFMDHRLVENTRSASFWETETRIKVLTFADMRKSLQVGKATKLMMDSEVLFRRLLAVSKKRDVDLQLVLQHELAAVPPSLFHDDGNMRKCVKSHLLQKLEGNAVKIHVLPKIDGSTAYIFDGMALFHHQHESQFRTFEDLAQLLLRKMLTLLKGQMGIQAVVIVFDRYDAPNSIKCQERIRRGESASHVISASRIVPHYRNFLKNSNNKAALAVFVCEYIMANSPAMLSEVQSITLSGGFTDGKTAMIITRDRTRELTNLSSTQEEADTRMLLHAVHIAESHQRIVIRADDTDVLVLLVYYCSKDQLSDLVYMHAGHSGQNTNSDHYIPVHDICNRLGPNVCQALPTTHALTGCDTTSSLLGIGKRTAFTKLVQKAEQLASLASFGESETLEGSLPDARQLVLALYKGQKPARVCTTLDELRFHLATQTDKPGSSFPPTEDAFKQHVMRAKYQVSIWTKSHQAKPNIWNPEGNGWKRNQDGNLEPVMYEGEAAPLEVRDLTHLYCTDKDCANARKCQCLTSGLFCTDLCSCCKSDTTCSNVKLHDEGNSGPEESDDEQPTSDED